MSQNTKRKEIPDILVCPNNVGIECEPRNRNCAACGWNPAVRNARLEAYCTEQGIVFPGDDDLPAG